jgi:D-threo-aldose 1-dehydrogenase
VLRADDIAHLPRGGLSLTRLGLGCAQMGGLFRPTSEEDARAVAEAAWIRGLRYFDTAPFYGYGMSEHRLGAAVRGRPRAKFTLSTKVGRVLRPDATVAAGADQYHSLLPFRPHYDYRHDAILRSFEDSLQRLGTDRVDILYVHDIGVMTHGDAHRSYWQQLTTGGGFRALEELRADGRVRAIGLGVNEWEVVCDAMEECDLDCTMLAGRYTLLEQHSLAPLLERCVARRHAIVVAGPFNSGILVGGGASRKFNYFDAPAPVLERVAALEAVCRSFDVPLAAAALQFPMAHPAVVSCVAGARNPDQLQQNVAWFEQKIPGELWTTLKARGLLDERAPVPETC